MNTVNGNDPLLVVEGLTVSHRKPSTDMWTPLITDVELQVDFGRTTCVVGESGSGKSITGLAIAGLLEPDRFSRSGSVRLSGRELLVLKRRQMNKLRGTEIAMVFQEPMFTLNPTLTIGEQVAEPFRYHRGVSWADSRSRALEMLDRVGIPDAKGRMRALPSELSGGMQQRVVIAQALICEPALLIADEPTTALDVTVQAQVLALLKDLQVELGLGILLVTHDMGVVADVADRVVTMYAGEVVEIRDRNDEPGGALHPYSRALVAASPRITSGGARRGRLAGLPGKVPQPGEWPEGCRFASRCEWCLADVCCIAPVPLRPVGQGRVRCERAGEVVVDPEGAEKVDRDGSRT